MKWLKRGAKLPIAVALIVGGAIAGLNPRYELLKLFKRPHPHRDPDTGEDPKPLY